MAAFGDINDLEAAGGTVRQAGMFLHYTAGRR